VPEKFDEIARQLTALARAKTGDPGASVAQIETLPGHAGFSYSFVLTHRDGVEKLVVRLAPPGVRISGPADVVRQARVMQSLADTAVPVPPVKWFGDEAEFFGRPYFVVGFIAGEKLAMGETKFSAAEIPGLVRSLLAAMTALHAVDWRSRTAAWGEPFALSDELKRLDYLLDRPTLDPKVVARAPELRERLRSSLPAAPRIGCVHGDFQWSNSLFHEGRLNALIDWEISMIGATLLDLGWLCLFSDPQSWVGGSLVPGHLPAPDEICDLYAELAGSPVSLDEVRWFRAFSGYRFGVITVFNLMLHRRGKRVDPTWEDVALSAPLLFEHGLELLGH
jgi:aminoglycoside phosphotransferase (APT) family kinase protein